MNTPKTILNIKNLALAFEKIFKGIEKLQLDELDKELIKIYPSNNSQVLLSTDYDDDENSVGLSIYVSNPTSENNLQKIEFDKLMFQYLIYADITKLNDIWECIQLMERKDGDKYDLDFIPVFYNDQLGDYYIHCRITKNI